MKRPSFFIAGNSKSGTTALYKFLASHPDLYLCKPKEPNFFAKDLCRDPDPEGSFHPRTEEEYLALFEDAGVGQTCGEASACYLYSRVAAAEVHAFDPEARLIVMFREPVDFLYSYFLQLLKNPVTEGEVVRDFRQALDLEPARKRGEQIPKGCYLPELLYYTERVRYVEQLERIYRHFPKEQVHLIIYDDFKKDNQAVYRAVLAFLGVRKDFSPDFKTHNRGAELTSRKMQRLFRTLTFGEGWGRPVKAMFKGLFPESVRRSLVQFFKDRMVYKPKTGVDEETEAMLKARFYDEVVAFSRMTGRDLVREWGYDQVHELEPT